MIPDGCSFVADFTQTLDPFFSDLFGEGVGYVAVSYGKVPNTPVFYEWPAEKNRLLREAAEHNKTTNVFFSPALRANKGAMKLPKNCAEDQTPSLPVEPLTCLWADVDLVDDQGKPKEVNHTLLRELAATGAWRVRSGRPGHEHDYFPLAEPVDLATFERLNTDLKNALGADHAQSHVKWLRLPTFVSYKPDLPHPREVLITEAPTKRWAVDDLEARIRPQRSRKGVTGRRQGTRAPGRQRATEARVRRLLRRCTGEGGDRSAQFDGVVVSGVEDGVSLDRLEELLNGHVVVPERYEGRLRQEIERSASKAKPRIVEPVEPGRQTSWTLGDLMSAQFPVLSWAVDGFIPEGLTLLVSAPKIGKSYLTMNLALALVFDIQAMGSLGIEPGEVLVIPLDDPSPRRMQQRLDQIMRAMPDKGQLKHELHLELDWPTLAEGGGLLLDEWLSEHPNCRMVVIDTLSRLRDAESRASSDPGKPDEQAMAEFKRIADKHRVAIVGTHHDRKAEGNDFLDMVSGNKKLTGGADTIVYLTRARNQDHAVAKITGRDVEEREVALRFDHPLWVVSDHTPAELAMSDTRRLIVDYLREHGKGTAKGIADATGKKYTTVNQRLFTMLSDGQVCQPGGERTPYELPRAGA